jgi:DNA-binding response OmpR family regulator
MPNETILILDNESHSRWTLKTLLENEHYPVVAVDTIERALRNFSEFEVSAFITESWINRSSTAETIRELKTRFPACYVMVLTDKEMKENAYAELLGAGVDDCFLKPLSTRKILLHIEKGLSRRKGLFQRKFTVEPLEQDAAADDLLETERNSGEMAMSKSSM